jgi:hypothetical protein
MQRYQTCFWLTTGTTGSNVYSAMHKDQNRWVYLVQAALPDLLCLTTTSHHRFVITPVLSSTPWNRRIKATNHVLHDWIWRLVRTHTFGSKKVLWTTGSSSYFNGICKPCSTCNLWCLGINFSHASRGTRPFRLPLNNKPRPVRPAHTILGASYSSYSDFSLSNHIFIVHRKRLALSHPNDDPILPCQHEDFISGYPFLWRECWENRLTEERSRRRIIRRRSTYSSSNSSDSK